MKILICTEYFPYTLDCDFRGGVEARTYFAAKELAKENQVTIIAAKEQGQVQVDFPGMKVLRVGPDRLFTQGGELLKRYQFIRAAVKTGKSLDVDVVEGTNFLAYRAAMKIAEKKKIPAVCTYHDVWVGQWRDNLGLLPGIIGEFAERKILKYPWNKIIAVSTITRSKLLDQGVYEKTISVVPNGFDFENLPQTQEKFEVPTIIYVGRLVKYKRVGDIIEAMAKLKKSLPKVRLIIIGTGPKKCQIEKQINDLGLQGYVQFRGFVEKYQEVLSLIARSQVLCLPSTVEGFGLVTIEAMAVGTPYVSSEIPPTVEVTQNGIGGILYPPGNISELTQALLSIMTDKKYSQQLGEAGKNFVEQRYNWHKIGEQLRRVYREIK
ncbi:MAG: glycosyltransferase family 4 protein [bacterium]